MEYYTRGSTWSPSVFCSDLTRVPKRTGPSQGSVFPDRDESSPSWISTRKGLIPDRTLRVPSDEIDETTYVYSPEDLIDTKLQSARIEALGLSTISVDINRYHDHPIRGVDTTTDLGNGKSPKTSDHMMMMKSWHKVVNR